MSYQLSSFLNPVGQPSTAQYRQKTTAESAASLIIFECTKDCLCYESWSFVVNKLFWYIFFCQCRLTLRYPVMHHWYAFNKGVRVENVKHLAGNQNT